MRILFSNEKFIDIDNVYNSQRDQMWAVSRTDVNKKGGIQQREISTESNSLVGRLSQGLNAIGDSR